MNPTQPQQAINPLSYYDDPGLVSARQSADSAGGAYKTAVSNAGTMPDMLKSALDKQFSKDNPLIQQREGALKNYLTVAESAPTTVLPQNNNGMVFSPNQQAAIIAGLRAGAFAPITSANELLAWQQGGIGNAVDKASKMYEVLARVAQVEAENKRNSYQDLLGLADRKSQAAAQQQQFQENVRQFGLEFALKQEQARKSGGGGIGSSILSALGAGFNQPSQQQQVPTRPAIDSFWEDDSPPEQQAINYRSQPMGGNAPSLWDTITGWLGATPRQEVTPSNQAINDLKLNFGGLPGLNTSGRLQ